MSEEERSKLMADALLLMAKDAELDCYVFVGIRVVGEEPSLKLAVTSLGNRRDAIDNLEAVKTVAHHNLDEVLKLMFKQEGKTEKGLLN